MPKNAIHCLNPLFLEPVTDLLTMLAQATAEITAAGFAHEAKWRVKGRRRLAKLAGKMREDYIDRRENDNCDPNMRNVVEVPPLDDELERGLSDLCKEQAKPVRLLSQEKFKIIRRIHRSL